NKLTSGWSVQEQTFLDTGNGVFTTATPLSSFTFNAIGTQIASAVADSGSGLFAVTELYTINATGPGTALSTIDVASTPLPAALPLFASGLVGLWWTRRKKGRQQAA